MEGQDYFIVLLIGLIPGFCVGFITGAMTESSRSYSASQIIDAGCGHYDAKTGEFVMGRQ